MKAFVAGATGGTGRRIVEELVQRGISVRAMVRDLETAKATLPNQVELVLGNVLDKKAIEEAISDCNVVLCATGARPSLDPFGPLQVDYLGAKNLIDVAKAKNIEHFVLVTSLCTSRFFHPLNLFWLVLFWKKQAEKYLKASGITYTIVRPGGLKNEDTGGALVMSAADTLFGGSIPRAKVAQVCVDALSQPDARNKVVEVVVNPDVAPQTSDRLFASIN
ncbi:MAG: SDR family oxidoreductase [Pseudanabaena sp. CRU_2_10]|nr:SDR family oxidoreductase [Pseudanabaena sp. CRU_2_10]